jgi:hypothetical protein
MTIANKAVGRERMRSVWHDPDERDGRQGQTSSMARPIFFLCPVEITPPCPSSP